MNPLNHDQARRLIQRQPQLSPVEHAALAEHLAICPDCRAESELFDRLVLELPAAFPGPLPVPAVNRERIALVQHELRRQHMSANRISIPRLAAGVIALVGLVLVISWVVRSLTPIPAASQTAIPTATQTVTPAPHPGTLPSGGISLPSSTPRATFTAIPEPTQTASPAEPLISGESIRTNGWSPDGQWLAYWYAASRAETPPRGPWPSGELQFTNPSSGLICPHPEVTALSYAPGAWTPSGEFLVAEGGEYLAGVPCGEFRALSQAEYADLLPPPAYDPALSTAGSYRAETTILSQENGILQAETVFSEASSGREVFRLGWSRWDALGDLGLGGEWLDDTTFLVHQSLERGPLLVSLNGTLEVIEVAQGLFGVENVVNPDPDNYTGWVAFGSPVASEGGVTHILLLGTGMEAAFPDIMLFHSEDARVETLPFKSVFNTGFIPAGRPAPGDQPWLVVAETDFSSGYEQRSYYYREIDAPGPGFTLLGDTYHLEWLYGSYTAPDNRLALGWDAGRVRVQTFPGEQVLGEFSTGKFSAAYLDWAPGGQYLAVSGSTLGGSPPQMGLFIIEIPQP